MRLTVEALTVAREGRPVVSDVSLDVPPGSVVGLLGPNGSGKSTLLRACFRALRPASGRVLVDGTDLAGLSRRLIAQRIGVMTQEPPDEVGLSVAATVLLGRTPHQRGFGRDSAEDRRLAADAMARVGVDHLADRLVHTLSGGERQRALLARAVTQQAGLLLLDEPTNHLDLAYRFELMRLVTGLGVTAVVALHDLELALAYCDQVAVLTAGRLVAAGPPAEVLTPDLVRDVFRVHATPTVHPATGRNHLLLTHHEGSS